MCKRTASSNCLHGSDGFRSLHLETAPTKFLIFSEHLNSKLFVLLSILSNCWSMGQIAWNWSSGICDGSDISIPPKVRLSSCEFNRPRVRDDYSKAFSAATQYFGIAFAKYAHVPRSWTLGTHFPLLYPGEWWQVCQKLMNLNLLLMHTWRCQSLKRCRISENIFWLLTVDLRGYPKSAVGTQLAIPLHSVSMGQKCPRQSRIRMSPVGGWSKSTILAKRFRSKVFATYTRTHQCLDWLTHRVLLIFRIGIRDWAGLRIAALAIQTAFRAPSRASLIRLTQLRRACCNLLLHLFGVALKLAT